MHYSGTKLLFLFSLIIKLCFSQTPFEKIYDWNADYIQNIQTHDSSYYCLINNKLIKLNTLGQVLWEKPVYCDGKAITQGDNAIYISGISDSKNNRETQLFIGKFDLSGDTIWTKKIGGLSIIWEVSNNILYTEDNSIVLAARGKFFGNYRLVIFKLDTIGNIHWYTDLLYYNFEIQNLQYIDIETYEILLKTNYYGSCLISVDSSGTVKNTIFWSDLTDYAKSFYKLSDNNYLLLLNYGLIQIDTLNQFQTFFSQDTVIFKSMICNDTSIIICGYNDGYYINENILLYNINYDGDINWVRFYGGLEDEIPYSIFKTLDNGFFITGWSSSWGKDEDINYLIKTDKDGFGPFCADSLIATNFLNNTIESFYICIGSYREIRSNSIGSYAEIYWIVDEDTIHEGNTPFTIYGEVPGTYNLILTSCNDSLIVPVIVRDTLNSNFTYELINNGIQYYQDTIPEGWSWRWNMGDGVMLNDSLNPFYSYFTNGNYFTTLEIRQPCYTSTTKRIFYHLITDELSNETFIISPNPSKKFIKINLPEFTEYELILYNIKGQPLKSYKINGSINHQIDLRGLTNGIYFLRIIYNKGTSVKRIIKSE